MAPHNPRPSRRETIIEPLYSCVLESLSERNRFNPLPGDRLEWAAEFTARLEESGYDGGSYGAELDWWLHTEKGYTDSWIVEYLAEGYIDLEGNKGVDAYEVAA